MNRTSMTTAILRDYAINVLDANHRLDRKQLGEVTKTTNADLDVDADIFDSP